MIESCVTEPNQSHNPTNEPPNPTNKSNQSPGHPTEPPSEPQSNAYVWLLFRDDSYLPGLLTSIHSLKKTKPTFDLVVMVTDDIDEKTTAIIARHAKVILVPYIKFPRKQLNYISEQLYGDNSDLLNTKWNALNLTQYKKVLLLDCDTLIFENIDHLFTLDTPAAPFSSSFCKPLGTVEFYYANEYLPHNAVINSQDVIKSLNHQGTVLIASTVLLSPSADDYRNFIQSITTLTQTEPFGFNCLSGIAEQAITYYYTMIKKQTFHNIHHRYNYFSWNPEFLDEKDTCAVLHIISKPKPWQQRKPHIDETINYIIELNHNQADHDAWHSKHEDFEASITSSSKPIGKPSSPKPIASQIND